MRLQTRPAPPRARGFTPCRLSSSSFLVPPSFRSARNTLSSSTVPDRADPGRDRGGGFLSGGAVVGGASAFALALCGALLGHRAGRCGHGHGLAGLLVPCVPGALHVVLPPAAGVQGAPACHGVHRRADRAAQSPVPTTSAAISSCLPRGASAHRLRCCSSIWTISRPSTTSTAMPRAMWCCSVWGT